MMMMMMMMTWCRQRRGRRTRDESHKITNRRAGDESHKITEYFPIRRSSRMTTTQLKVLLVTLSAFVFHWPRTAANVTAINNTATAAITTTVGSCLSRPFCRSLTAKPKHRLGPCSVFIQKQVFDPRTVKSQPIWIKFCTHLLLYGIHLWADLDRDRRVGGSRPNQNDYVFVILESTLSPI